MDSKTSGSADFDVDDGWETPTPPSSEPPSAAPAEPHTPLVRTETNEASGTDTAAVEPAGEKQTVTDDLDDGWDLDLPSAPHAPPPIRPPSGAQPASSTARPDPPEALRSNAARRKTKSSKSSSKNETDTSASLPAALTGRRPKTRTKARVHRKSQERASKTKEQRQDRVKQRKQLRDARRRERREAARAANRAANPQRSNSASRSERRPPVGSSERDSAPAPRAQAVPASQPSRRQPRVVVRKRDRSVTPPPDRERQDDRSAESRTQGRSVSASDPRTSRGIAVLLVIAVAVGVLIWLARGG